MVQRASGDWEVDAIGAVEMEVVERTEVVAHDEMDSWALLVSEMVWWLGGVGLVDCEQVGGWRGRRRAL